MASKDAFQWIECSVDDSPTNVKTVAERYWSITRPWALHSKARAQFFIELQSGRALNLHAGVPCIHC
ncbi:hypothetical protein CVS29_17300 [Arthrobacter psychrochitiniphilus]|uniref:Uncharacterized protein n=1 Tax=Arthrobacter psychrochitiniphilus TaxID=291045 RepID=A0A2V3DNF1_9MICC|nr:hypothetical protein CVS29_17300 [Arthrobacter psychrochitiniphilus]